MSLLTIQNLTYHIGDKTLYQNAGFTLFHGEHIGVTGKNGVGKSTLLKLLQSDLLPDEGDIIWQPAIRIGYLDQHAEMNAAMTVRDYLQTAFANLYALEAEMMAIYASPEQCSRDSFLARAAEIQATLESQAFYLIDNRIDAIADGLGIVQFGMETRLGSLSGGQRHKVMLASLLLIAPDVLLLDEPTNYLDTVHVDWLAEYLNSFEGALMVVSHDRAFLNRIATGICDIDHQQIRKYKGNVEKAMAQKASDDAAHAKQYLAQKKHIDKLEQFIAKNGAGVNASIANGRKKQLARMERLSAPEQEKTVSISFRTASHSAQQVLAATDLEIGYTRPLLPKMDFNIARGEKVVIAGFNGIGKSTLLKTLVSELAPIAGDIELAQGVKLGYFEQELHWYDPQATPVNLVKSACHGLDDKAARQHLARFGLSGKLALQPIHSLSGGEQTKVKLCRLALQPTNLLVLDEPTTHLDARVKAALKQALMDYTGTLILVSHERDFVAGWPDKVINIQKMMPVADSELV
ncbi:ABC-F family ATP-binding cassette domain-containing protein [Photobacterium sp. 1_MG-2023]|uniref:ABC-F family ATP-binding cassette domain-containing protein n=1 Tax=Photobacterium sp. 1_MG-2023 TaxID=3062646 RepID=UPI0026E1E0D6|nr:ABC-F family ATP-binding cassette domain-containing protein [Photobacterium sp. 1_MG-2023]MDO6707218.1 ABC-F family ATP-binding cassette domain-containing protein [Photobacterium sp. 1_MG-2023]